MFIEDKGDSMNSMMEVRAKERERDIWLASRPAHHPRYTRAAIPLPDVAAHPLSRSFSLEDELPALWKSFSDVERARLKNTKFIFGEMAASNAPNPPAAFVSTLPSDTPTGSTLTVGSGKTHATIQAAMNAVVLLNQNLNHVIEINVGELFSENLVTPPKTGTGWVTVRTSDYASLPAGTRVDGTNAHMATVQVVMSTANPVGDARAGSALIIPDGSNGWRFVGIEFTMPTGLGKGLNQLIDNLVVVGNNSTQANGWHSPSGPALASRVSFERCFIHGRPYPTQLTKALSLLCRDAQVWDSWIIDAHRDRDGATYGPQECQAIYLGDGAGPFQIENNELQAAGQCIFFYMLNNSGDWNGMPYADVIPQDAIVRRNHLYIPPKWKNTDQGLKDPTWDGSHYTIKQLLEFKSGQRILIQGNTLENLFGGQGQAGQTPGFVAYFPSDIRIESNVFKDCSQGFYIGSLNPDVAGDCSTPVAFPPGSECSNDRFNRGQFSNKDIFGIEALYRRRIAILNNLFLRVDGTFFDHSTDTGSLALEDIWIEHNTQIATNNGAGNVGRAIQYKDPSRSIRFTLRNNIIAKQQYGPSLDGRDGAQTDAQLLFDQCFGVDRDFRRNVMLGGQQGSYNPAAFSLFQTLATAGINADGTLTALSPLKAGGAAGATDSTDNGVNFTNLNAALVGVIDVTAPTVPSNLGNGTPTPFSFNLTWDASTDAVGVALYTIEVTDVATGTILPLYSSSTNSKLISGLSPARQYSARAKAADASGNSSAYSSPRSVTTAADNGVPPATMRGFGPSRGVAAGDYISIPLTASAAQRTYAFWTRMNGVGGSQAGQIMVKAGAYPLWIEGIGLQNAQTMSYARNFSGGPGVWSFPAPPPGARALVVIKYDSGDVANVPIVKINDVVQTISRLYTPVGTPLTDANPITIGNWGAAPNQNWDGDIAKFAVYDFLTSDANDTALYTGSEDPETIGANATAYHKLNGQATEPDEVSTDASTLVGTKVQVYTAATLSITSLAVSSGDPLAGAYQVTAVTTGGTPNRVEFYVDGTLSRSDTSAPFTLFASADVIGAGPHTIEARVFAGAGGIPDDVKTLVVTEPTPADSNFWDLVVAWDRLPGALGYNFYINTTFIALIPQPPSGQPSYAFRRSGDDITLTYWIAGTYPNNVEGPRLAITRRYNAFLQQPTGFQELSKGHTT